MVSSEDFLNYFMNLSQIQLFILFLTSVIILPVVFSLPFKRRRRIKSEKERIQAERENNFAETGNFETDYERSAREMYYKRIRAARDGFKINIYQHLGDWDDK